MPLAIHSAKKSKQYIKNIYLSVLRKNLHIHILLVFFALLLRLPAFPIPIIDQDEGIYITMGQDLLKGHLPYYHLFEMKPPGLFAAYALLVKAGQTIIGIRLLGALIVALSAMLLFHAASFALPRSQAVLAALLFISFSTFLGSGTCVMGEHIASLPLCALVWVCCRKEKLSAWDYFACGVLVGCAGIMRTNLFIAGLACAVWIISSHCPWRQCLKHAIALACGGLLLPGIITGIYAAHSQLPLLFAATITAPAAYVDMPFFSSTKQSMLVNFIRLLHPASLIGYSPVPLLLAICGIIYSAMRRNAANVPLRRLTGLLCTVLLSILLTGQSYSHYLIQTAPMMAVFAVAGFMWLKTSSTTTKPWRLHVISALCFVTASYYTLVLGYTYHQFNSYFNGEPNIAVYNSTAQQGAVEATKVAEFINSQHINSQELFACDYMVFYFLTKTTPPLYVSTPYLYNTAINNVMSGKSPYAERTISYLPKLNPRFIISGPYHEACKIEELVSFLNTHYTLRTQYGVFSIWEKNQFSRLSP